MPSPRGSYTPVWGPFAGVEFRSYFQYQQERARWQGFSNYSQERRAKTRPFFEALVSRAMDARSMTRLYATRLIQQGIRSRFPEYMAEESSPSSLSSILNAPGHAVGTPKEHRGDLSGYRKHLAIRLAMDLGLYDHGDDARDDIPY